MIKKLFFLILFVFMTIGLNEAFAQGRRAQDVRVFPVNDLGMHCMDKEFSIFSLLPPFNVINSQVVLLNPSGLPVLLDNQSVSLHYSAVMDPKGSINSWSTGKTDFWRYSNQLFGVNLQQGESLTGLYMPSDAPLPGPQAFIYETAHQWFSAFGIPITPRDDFMDTNTYPLLKVSAHEIGTNIFLNSTDAVVPVSGETSCRNCHQDLFPYSPANNLAPRHRRVDQAIERLTKMNILKLHDILEGTDLINQRPVLCASCHYSPALDLAGNGPTGPQVGKPTMSESMHLYHGQLEDHLGSPIFPPNGSMNKTCYQCHPGRTTKCLRGPMATAGMTCLNCHGDMLSVGGKYPLLTGGSIDGTNDGKPRRPWIDMPRCQSCHTGDAINHLKGSQYKMAPDNIRLSQTYKIGDASASPLLANNKRFAENTNKLYRFSKGHGGLMCEACHGSTHAEWPNADPNANDNVTSKQLQGHSGTIIECATCHVQGSLPRTTNGPHGLHNVASVAWYDDGHENFFKANEKACMACHGANLLGTPLSRAAADRTFYVEGTKKYVFKKGQQIGCAHCHGIPD